MLKLFWLFLFVSFEHILLLLKFWTVLQNLHLVITIFVKYCYSIKTIIVRQK